MNTNRPENMERYILEHLDEALEKDYIRVYVQPVVRSLTRQVCGMEALARWQDPEYGLLMPGEFIPVLEKHRRIHELDLYVLRYLCETYKRTGHHIGVPVSINLSRLDYELCDIFEEVEKTVRANKVPRSILCIEVTESALSSNEELMRQYIERFRAAGYAVWMDDFGSGYSSLNVLKDYEFDELKIDMRFLSDFHTRSKKILATIVNMAKQIGIQTLAEGVETEEQFAFLRNIGCEKVQGYLFGKPMPFSECRCYVAERGMQWEDPKLRRYYDDIGRLNVLSATPVRSFSSQVEIITGRELNSISLAIVELRGDEAELLFSNQAFETVAAAVDWPLLWAEQHTEPVPLSLNRLSQRLQKLMEETRSQGKSKLMLVYDNDYYEMRSMRLSRQGEACAILINVTNLSQLSSMVNQQQLDEGLRSLYSVYEQVSLINLNDGTVISLHQDSDSDHKLPTGSLAGRIEEYTQRLFPDDRERFHRFIDTDTIEERTAKSGATSIYLRVLSFHGAYEWKLLEVVRIRQNIFYLLIRSAETEVQELRAVSHVAEPSSDDTLSPRLLWENVVNNADIKFFWKDRQRRFVGASRSFMEHYAFESTAEFVGKTDEDMGWHVNTDPFRDEEWKVLNEGIVSRRAEGNCISQGENQSIVATKMPLFSQDGKIVGLIGTFAETESNASVKSGVQQARTDELTGLLNSRGLYEDLFAYVDEYQLRGRDFARVEIAIDGFADINARYGYDFGDAVIRRTGQALLDCCGSSSTVGRISGCVFTVLCQMDDPAELDALIESIRRIPAELSEIDGIPFNMYLSVGMALYSETKNLDAMAAQAEMRRMTDDVENISQHQLMENTSRIFHMFDDLPLSYAVYKIVSGPEENDAIVLYANKRFMYMTHLSPEKLIGRKVSSFFALSANTWIDLAEKAGVEGKSVQDEFYHSGLDTHFSITAYPVIGPGFCAFTFQTVKKEK